MSGPVRGMSTIDPFGFFPAPCGINPDKKPASRSCRDLRNEGCTPYELHVLWGFSGSQMSFAGCSASELAEAGVPTREIAHCRSFTALECRDAGCSAKDM